MFRVKMSLNLTLRSSSRTSMRKQMQGRQTHVARSCVAGSFSTQKRSVMPPLFPLEPRPLPLAPHVPRHLMRQDHSTIFLVESVSAPDICTTYVLRPVRGQNRMGGNPSTTGTSHAQDLRMPPVQKRHHQPVPLLPSLPVSQGGPCTIPQWCKGPLFPSATQTTGHVPDSARQPHRRA
jgi:hypothetical protein